MIQGLYIASQSMSSILARQDHITHNLANANTTAYKQSRLFIKAFDKYLANDELKPNVNREIKADVVAIDFSEGALINTGNPLDWSLKGSGFFTVMTPHGIAYTRNGNFSLDAEGYIVTSEGFRLMSKEGFIRLDEGAAVSVNVKGEIHQRDTLRGVLRIADFDRPYRLVREGNSCYVPQEPEYKEHEAEHFQIVQGYLESSNVNTVKNMVEMINAFRTYEANQRAVLAQDETLQKAVQEVGRVQ